MIDRVWHDINLRNDKIDVLDGAYILNIPLFNEEVIREAINNAIAHRDYRSPSETFILQYQDKLVIKNAGGFPYGVNLENLLRTVSTPRNRLLADVLSKTGIVERSGQGVDKIFRNMLSEGKEAPDYSHSTDFQVELQLSAKIKDIAFAQFIASEQKALPEEERLSVFEILALEQIRNDKYANIDPSILRTLIQRRMIEKRGKTKGTYYLLSKSYHEFAGKEGEYTRHQNWSFEQAWTVILAHFSSFERGKMKAFEEVLQNHMTRRQVRQLVEQLVEKKHLLKQGKGSGTYYTVGPEYLEQQRIKDEALELGLEEMRKRKTKENVQNMSKTLDKNTKEPPKEKL